MKILMFGRGVISSQYAWFLEKSGNTVEFYVRKGRKEQYGDSINLNILDTRKKIRGVPIKQKWKVTFIDELTSNHDYDLIIVSVQHYQFKNVVDFLKDKIGNATILIFNNFWDEPKEAVSQLPFDQLVWGFPLAGGGFDNNDILNGQTMGSTIFGTFGTELTEREIKIRNLFISSGFKITEISDFRSWLFIHFIINAGLHIESLKNKSLMTAMLSSSGWANIKSNITETLPLLEARGVDIKSSKDLIMLKVPSVLLALAMKVIIKTMPPVKMILTGHNNEEELKSYCRDVLSTANKLKINLPRFEQNKKLFQ